MPYKFSFMANKDRIHNYATVARTYLSQSKKKKFFGPSMLCIYAGEYGLAVSTPCTPDSACMLMLAK